MQRLFFTFFAACLILPLGLSLRAEKPANTSEVEPIDFSSIDWPWWRGIQRNGIAADNQNPPIHWDKTKNVLWKSPVPGRGHSSPTVVGNQIFLAAADEAQEIQSVVCYDRNTGKQLWKTDIHKGGFTKKGNKKSTQASSSVACDGKRLFINFINNEAMFTTALNRSGKQLWQQKITDYTVHQGYGSSPALYGPLVIVSADNKGEKGGAIAGLNRATGAFVWKKKRPSSPNYASPIILKVNGRDQLLFTGCDLVSSFEPLTGKTLWEIEGSTTECVTSTVTDGKHIFTSGGYPKNHMAAVLADGSGKVVWENKTRVYVPSMLVHDGYIFAVLDAGIAQCWKADTGEEIWKHRLSGTFTSSPILAAGNIYVTNEVGKTFIFKANPKKYEAVAQNSLGNGVFASPTICGSRIYLHVVEETDGKRQEMLYCIGKRE